jgi:uncharacterized protein YuzE
VRRGRVAESEPISDNLILDLNRKGEIIGVKILGPKSIDISKLFPQACQGGVSSLPELHI